jgi:hypothetical protein
MTLWKRGRGALGPMQPLLGVWRSTPGDDKPASKAPCMRTFSTFGKDYLRLDANWDMGDRGAYREIALFGKGDDSVLAFWSFTSDGKRSTGILCDGNDVHADAVAFTANMPAGTARMLYWPLADETGFRFAVESQTKKGWNRFFEHVYRPADAS